MTGPLIGITGRVKGEPGRRLTGVHEDYAHAVQRAGGLPLILPPAAGPGAAEACVTACHGLVISGGEDLGEDAERDAFERALFRQARRNGVPVLAICRGFQLVNVELGGNLWSDLPEERPSDLDHDHGAEWDVRSHHVSIVAGTRTHSAVGCETLYTNSFHHQGIRELAGSLTVSATAEDGVIEAAETTDAQWLVGVQWHPESFWREDSPAEQGLFDELVRVSRGFGSGGAL